MRIVSQIKDMGFLLTAPLVGLDIESMTTPPEGHPAAGLKDAYGLSYNADIIAISLHAGPNHPTAVFLEVDKFNAAQRSELREFLIKVLCRKVTLIGHNVIFDARSVGGHFGFELPIETKIWDTMVMQRKLLVIDVPSVKIIKGYFGLLSVAEKWSLISDDERTFLKFMKERRGSMSEFLDMQVEADERIADAASSLDGPAEDMDLPEEVELDDDLSSAMDDAIQQAGMELTDNSLAVNLVLSSSSSLQAALTILLPSDILWKFAGGFAPNKVPQKARQLLETYVGYDAMLAYQIYQRQIAFANEVATCGEGNTVSPIPNVNVPYWPDILDLLEGWQNQLRIDANMAIKGLPVDLKHLKKRMEETKTRALELAPKLVFENDPSDPYPEFKEIFSQMIWYAMILDKLANGKVPYNTPTPNARSKGWVNWKQIPLDHEILLDALHFPGEIFEQVQVGTIMVEKSFTRKGVTKTKMVEEPIYESRTVQTDRQALKQKWAEWLTTLSANSTWAELSANPPDLRTPPKLDLKMWVKQQCFPKYDTLKADYFAHLKTRWLKTYYRLTDARDAIKLASALHFKPFYMFVVAGWPLYSHTDLKYELSLGTKKFQNERTDREKIDPEIDLQRLAVEMDALSCGKKPLEWIFKRIADWTESGELEDHPEHAAGAAHLKEYEELLTQWNTHKRMVEYYLHAQRDGKIHSLLVPSTVTGRDNSTLPNLQNIKMTDDKGNPVFAGIFVAPPGYTLVELDLNNAENMMSGLISGDTNFINAIMSGDYHLKQAHLYWPMLMAELEKIADPKKRAKAIKKQRNKGKSATFALPYGAGEKKMISLLGVTQAEAASIIKRLKEAYPEMARKKEQLQNNCKTRVQNGRLPAYTTLFDKTRVFVDTFQNRIQGYTIWNYVLQGGVASIIHPAMVLIEQLCFDRGYESHILLSVHDSIIMAIKNTEFSTTPILQECCEIMGSQVPAEMCNRTIPGVVFASDYTPDNKEKWGLRFDQEYALPTDVIINRYGTFPLIEGEEHETWKGPKHLGWTLETEIAERTAARAALEEQPEALVTALPTNTAPSVTTTLAWPQEFETVIKEVMANRQLVYRDAQGKERVTPILDFEELAQVAEAMYHRGDPLPHQAIIDGLTRIQVFLQSKLEVITHIKQEVGG